MSCNRYHWWNYYITIILLSLFQATGVIPMIQGQTKLYGTKGHCSPYSYDDWHHTLWLSGSGDVLKGIVKVYITPCVAQWRLKSSSVISMCVRLKLCMVRVPRYINCNIKQPHESGTPKWPHHCFKVPFNNLALSYNSRTKRTVATGADRLWLCLRTLSSPRAHLHVVGMLRLMSLT